MSKNRYARLPFDSAASTGLLLTVLSLALSLMGCSSVDTRVNKGSVKASTFSFMPTPNRQAPTYAETAKQAHALVQNAIINNLSSKGVTHISAGGDVTVAYLIIVGNNVATTSLNEYFGYSDDSSALVQEVHDSGAGSSKESRDHFESGTLVIDFVDPSNAKLIQRRSIQAPVVRDLSTQERSARLQTIVDQALASVPISH
jgi:hypothetical protein